MIDELVGSWQRWWTSWSGRSVIEEGGFRGSPALGQAGPSSETLDSSGRVSISRLRIYNFLAHEHFSFLEWNGLTIVGGLAGRRSGRCWGWGSRAQGNYETEQQDPLVHHDPQR